MYKRFNWSAWLFFHIGILIMATGIVMMIRANLGASPWDVFHVGVSRQIPISFGVAMQLTGLMLVLISSIWTRTFPMIGTILNMIFVGLYSDFVSFFIPEMEGIFKSILFFVLGMILFALGTAIYIRTKRGSGPRDWLMLVMFEKLGLKIGWSRTMMEVAAVILGILLGGPFFWGTIIISLTIGHLIALHLYLLDRLMNKFQTKTNQYKRTAA
ncbi:YczE/YyaS/YitT family protein [Aquibacillus albus]|uniref:Membrane protein YczE n=1 Tax=Aquibacillus albus TaxID=1168171 RepID=A0ABS2MXU3_9BACI|nr:YitT family protein [Aquibacillus albus]MBM7570718.1 putative membrane protein YczE [Aquibacillus albus]